jgi:hypothetical protein
MSDILELRERAKRDLTTLFGEKPEDITESAIMYLVGCYLTNVDIVGLAIGMMDKKGYFECPITGEDKTEMLSEEEKVSRRFEQMKKGWSK